MNCGSQVLGALCLSQAGLRIVEEVQPVGKFMKAICADKKVAMLQVRNPQPSTLNLNPKFQTLNHKPSTLSPKT